MLIKDPPTRFKDILVAITIVALSLLVGMSVRPIENSILEYVFNKIVFIISIIFLIIFALCWFQVFRSAFIDLIRSVKIRIKNAVKRK
ncbi:MAG: hypothetical protein A3C51_04290 [Omnitrophica bacterium RIFCSPHIGHO2_02_FULL_46_20]|nr:MAG: hypothetical protein A3C51_04290 [Omnitrophica bacterium RIFCSPHIGHO2_02_FULL_46_20]